MISLEKKVFVYNVKHIKKIREQFPPVKLFTKKVFYLKLFSVYIILIVLLSIFTELAHWANSVSKLR